MRKIKLIFAALILLVSGQVSAALIDKGTWTADTVNGLNWLDVTESVNRSYNDVSTQFGAGGDFHGWRYATADEVRALFVTNLPSFTTSVPPTGNIVAGDYYADWQLDSNGEAASIASLFGNTPYLYGGVPAPGFIAMFDRCVPGCSAISHAAILNDLTGGPNNGFTLITMAGSNILDREFPYIGSLLVSPVPVPPALLLFGTGILGLIGFSKRRKAA